MRVFIIKNINLILVAGILCFYQRYAGERQCEVIANEEKTRAVSELSGRRDGEFEGSGTGFGGDIKVKLVIENNKIQSAQIVSAQGETAEYLASAKMILEEVVQKQTEDVDTVSGATLSSNGILEAVRQAMEKCDEK